MNKKFYFIASLLFASAQMGLAQNSIVKRVDIKDIPTVKAPAQAFTQVTKLTGWKYTNDEGITENVSVQYDDKGRFQTIDHGTYKELISYTDGTNGQWIEMTITKSEGSTLIPQYKNVRTQDAEGRIVTEKVYENTDGEQLSLTHSYAYAYSVVDNAERISLIEDMKYDEFNPEGTGTKYVWCEPTKSYIENRYEAYKRTITTIKDGTYSTIRQSLYDGKDTWTTRETEDIRYDNKGEQCYYLRKSYTRDGRLMEAEGKKTETAYNTPTAGYHTIISYTFTNGNDEDSSTDSQPNLADYQWVPNQKKEVSDNYDQEQMVYGEKKSCKIYSYDNGNWILDTDESIEWVNEHVLKGYVDKDEVGYVYYNGKELGSAYMFNDGSYMSEIDMDYQINGRDVIEYTLYDKQHNMLKKYREAYIGKENYLNTIDPTLLQEWDGTAWRNFVGTFKQGEGACSKTKICDEKGRITDSYKYDDKGETMYRITTTYKDNAYTKTEYEWKEDHSDLYASDERTYSIDGNGTYQYLHYEYDQNHNIYYGRMDKEYTNGVSETYSWDGSGWILRNSWVSDLTSTNGDETTTISRKWQNGKIVETGKRIEVHTADYYKSEEYVKQNGKWVGESKQESRKVTYHTDFATTPANPLQDYYNKTNTIDASEPGEEDISNIDEDDRTWHQWDEATGDWKIYRSKETTFQIVGNTMTETIKRTEDGGKYINTIQIIYKRDAQMRLTSVEETDTKTNTDTDSSDSNHEATLYTYDDEGNLLSEQITDIYGRTSTYIYQYGKIDVVNGIESGIDDARGSIIVTGRNIQVAGAQGLALYSLSGTLVSQSTSDVTEAPTSGLYILTSKDKKTKIFVK